MWPVFALLLTPCISLLGLSIAYAVFSPFCEQQNVVWIHGFYGVCLVANAILTIKAWPAGSSAKVDAPSGYGYPVPRRNFAGVVAGPIGLLFTLVTAAQWLTVWLFSPCIHGG